MPGQRLRQLMAALRVLLIGDDPLARSALAALLAQDPELLLVEQARSAEADVTVWDMGLPRERDDEARRGGFDAPLVALLASDAQVPEARARGARAILRRDTEAPRLLAALRAVAAGLVVLDDPAASALLRPAPMVPGAALEPLTPREQEVLQLLAAGLHNKEIARRLAISEHTAKFHVAKLLQKLGAESRSEAVFIAARLGLLLV